MWIEEQGVVPRLLVRDGDRKFSDAFKDFWAAQEVWVIRIPPRSPMVNAFAENWIGSLKRECLNFFICFSRRQLDHIVRCWTTHYNTTRPNRGFGMANRWRRGSVRLVQQPLIVTIRVGGQGLDDPAFHDAGYFLDLWSRMDDGLRGEIKMRGHDD